MLSANLYLASIRYFPLALKLAKNRLETRHLEEKKTVGTEFLSYSKTTLFQVKLVTSKEPQLL